jgi:predicted nucleotidyltransferase
MSQKSYQLLAAFTASYGGRFSLAELAGIAGIPRQTASRLLEGMAASGIIDYRVQGRNKLSFFDLSKKSTELVLGIIESQKSLAFQSRMKEASIIVNGLLKLCDTVVVFGSYASGSFSRSSDLDVLLAGDRRDADISGLKGRHSVEINEQRATYQELATMLAAKNPLAIEIMKNHVIFGDVSRIVKLFMEASG